MDYMKKSEKQIIPIFYAADENYLPYLAVSLSSLKENANKKYLYKIYILYTNIRDGKQKTILDFNDENFEINFINVTEKLNDVKNGLQLRDYYTGATYYRIFIANMFKEYDKAIYLDSDTIILGDISKLYKYNIKNSFVGAVADQVVASNKIFRQYSLDVLGIEPNQYFNAGILLMNLKKFRDDDFYKLFRSLLLKYKFKVAQDQDYLNVICKGSVRFLPLKWNTMPIGGEKRKVPKLIHYNLTLKPWHYADIPYAKYFWQYAQKSYYSDEIRKTFGNHTMIKKIQDNEVEANLLALALEEIEKCHNKNILEQLFEQKNINEILENELEKIEA